LLIANFFFFFSFKSKGGIFKAVEVDEAKLKRWKKEGNPWAFGYWRFDWADQTTRVANFFNNFSLIFCFCHQMFHSQ